MATRGGQPEAKEGGSPKSTNSCHSQHNSANLASPPSISQKHRVRGVHTRAGLGHGICETRLLGASRSPPGELARHTGMGSRSLCLERYQSFPDLIHCNVPDDFLTGLCPPRPCLRQQDFWERCTTRATLLARPSFVPGQAGRIGPSVRHISL